jgi:Spy/CpxP family protein refolding chaperone
VEEHAGQLSSAGGFFVMIGFLIGTACLLGFARVLVGGRRRRWHRYAHHHGGCGGHGYDRGSFFEEDLGFRGPPTMLRHFFGRLRTTPEQERAIRDAVDELRSAGRDARNELSEARREAARAMRSEVFSEEAVGGATAAFENTLDKLRKAGISAFAKVHGTLDDRQRAELADLIERGAQ